MRVINWMSPCLLLLAAACGGATDGAAPTEVRQAAMAASPGFVQPAGTVAINFSVDDRANRVYAAGDLRWKGSFLWDPATRLLTLDPYWTGAAPGEAALSGWPLLYDDGPWTTGGHEPSGAKAGDHVWGVTVFATPPSAGADVYGYGLIDASYETRLGSGWIWNGTNGSFSVEAGATSPITAAGMSFPRFGLTDLILTLDTGHLTQFPDWTWDLSKVTVKSSAWGWAEIPLTSMGRGQYLFVLSPHLGRGRLLPHTGLLDAGAVPEFVFVLGPDEYKNWTFDGTDWWPEALRGGVGAATFSWCTLRYTPATIELVANGNTAITVPASHCGWRGAW